MAKNAFFGQVAFWEREPSVSQQRLQDGSCTLQQKRPKSLRDPFPTKMRQMTVIRNTRLLATDFTKDAWAFLDRNAPTVLRLVALTQIKLEKILWNPISVEGWWVILLHVTLRQVKWVWAWRFTRNARLSYLGQLQNADVFSPQSLVRAGTYWCWYALDCQIPQSLASLLIWLSMAELYCQYRQIRSQVYCQNTWRTR